MTDRHYIPLLPADSERATAAPSSGAPTEMSPASLGKDDISLPVGSEEARLLHALEELGSREAVLVHRIRELEALFESRKQPLAQELADIRSSAARMELELESLKNKTVEEGAPPGPKSLRWVEGDLFNFLCMLVILVNFGVMILEMKSKDAHVQMWCMDQLFLMWYIMELALKALLHQRTFLLGRVTADRCFHWLDLVIVVSGILDQWAIPLLSATGIMTSGKDGSSLIPFNPSALRALRVLRITRMFRLLKALKLLLHMDLSWTDGRTFETFTTSVILANSVTMGLEVDIQWTGFYWLNVIFLVIYSFEVLVKLKRHGWTYFSHPTQATWNWLDFLIVSGGLIETLAVPAYETLVFCITGQAPERSPDGGILGLIRIFRLLRVLRLYRLLTMCKSLRKLVLGIADAMQGTIWVIILTFVVLYMFAIVFATLVGGGYVFGGATPEAAETTFGSVELSLYMLFKLMNDDQSVVMFTDSVWVRLLFMIAMVVLNWVMLATLTSVVTDHMNSSTSRAEKKEMQKEEREQKLRRKSKLINIFEEIDVDANGLVDRQEFATMLEDPFLRNEIVEASGLKTNDLIEIFEYLSHDVDGRRVIRYEDFVEKLHSEAQPASERAILRLECKMRGEEQRVQQRFENLMKLLEEPRVMRKDIHDSLRVDCPGPEKAAWVAVAEKVVEEEKKEASKRRMRGSVSSLDEPETP